MRIPFWAILFIAVGAAAQERVEFTPDIGYPTFAVREPVLHIQPNTILVSDPLEEDWRNLRSTSRDILVARQWNDKIAERYEENPAKGVSSRFIVATTSLAQAGEVSQILRSLAEGQAPEERLLKSLPQALHGTHDDIGEQSNRGPRHRVGQLGLHVVDVVASAAHRRKYRGV